MHVKELKVRIVKVSVKTYWYAYKIDWEYNVEDLPGLMDEYFCPEANGYIKKEDCIII